MGGSSCGTNWRLVSNANSTFRPLIDVFLRQIFLKVVFHDDSPTSARPQLAMVHRPATPPRNGYAQATVHLLGHARGRDRLPLRDRVLPAGRHRAAGQLRPR